MNEINSDTWFLTNEFQDGLREELRPIAFLPKASSKEGDSGFLAAQDARFLPEPLATELEDPKKHPGVLFGDEIVSTRSLGPRAKQFLERLKLVHELAPADILDSWRAGAVGKWLALFVGTDDRTAQTEQYKMLQLLLGALSGLDERQEWRDAELVCLPTAADGWKDRKTLSRYPADWNVLAQETEIRSSIEPFLGPADQILSWEFDNFLQTRAIARSYLERIPQPKLEDIVHKWWEHLAKVPSAEQTSLVVRLSAWVLKKQPQRKALIEKLLCFEAETQQLRPCGETLLTEPYAGAFREMFFPSTPKIASTYEVQGSMISRAEWRAFFESLENPPVGRFSLIATGKQMTGGELTKLFGEESFNMPYRRAGWMRTTFRGFPVDSHHYTIINAELPEALRQVMEKPIARAHFYAISQWLGESPAALVGQSSLLMVYIPYMTAYVTATTLAKNAAWVVALNNSSWVYAKSGIGPFRPRDILGCDDAARPQAPVAELPTELIEALRQCGVTFGTDLPDAPAIDRLRIQGPSATTEQLLTFVQNAIGEAVDEKKKMYLEKVLCEANLFPFPSGRTAVDGATRVPHRRIVWQTRGRSLLDWLVAIESFSEESPERALLDLTNLFLPFPQTTTFAQTLGYLSWVWSNTPDANAVRGFLPRAYSYVREDIQADEHLAQWNKAVSIACVFLQNKRKWIAVAGAADLFLDDLGDAGFDNFFSGLDLATPGHFGESTSDQTAVAKLLGVRRLSSRFRIAVEAKQPKNVPSHWKKGFDSIQNALREQVKSDDENEQGVTERRVSTNNAQLQSYQFLNTVLYDGQIQRERKAATAVLETTGTIAVSGAPSHFAEQLCEVLFSHWGLSLRRDLVKLIPRVAIRLAQLDDPEEAQPNEEKPTDVSPTETPESVPGTEEVDTAIAAPAGQHASKAPENLPSEATGSPAGQVNKGLPPPGGSYTADDREKRREAWIARKQELQHELQEAERRINESATIDVFPEDRAKAADHKHGEFRTDDPFRQAALQYELKNSRYPCTKDPSQAGHDLDSYTHAEGHPDRKLIRRIEVKGRTTQWDSGETVELSDRQFTDALRCAVSDADVLASDFDYWLYVVEQQPDNNLSVLALRNVAQRAAHFALHGGSWRHEAEKTKETSVS